MKTFKNYKSERPFRRPDRPDTNRDIAIAIGGYALFWIVLLATLFLLVFARGG